MRKERFFTQATATILLASLVITRGEESPDYTNSAPPLLESQLQQAVTNIRAEITVSPSKERIIDNLRFVNQTDLPLALNPSHIRIFLNAYNYHHPTNIVFRSEQMGMPWSDQRGLESVEFESQGSQATVNIYYKELLAHSFDPYDGQIGLTLPLEQSSTARAQSIEFSYRLNGLLSWGISQANSQESEAELIYQTVSESLKYHPSQSNPNWMIGLGYCFDCTSA